MPVTAETDLPSYEELTIADVNLSSAPLLAGAKHFGKYCDEQSKEFMLCKRETDDARACLKYGKEVSSCALEFFGKLKEHCYSEFTHYWQCMDHAHENLHPAYCRKPQAVFDKCAFDKLHLERPDFGYFAKTRIQQSARPRPAFEKPFLPPLVPEAPSIDSPEPSSIKYAGGVTGLYM